MTARLVDALGYRFARPELLEASLVHRSYAAEHPEAEDNERMEFLGDAVLQLVVTHYLYDHYPSLTEGEMAKTRAACVNREGLATIARRLDIGSHLRMGAGEESTGGREKDSILADAMEAVIAVVYLDGGYEAAREVVLAHWEQLIRQKAESPGRLDYKTRYQEQLAAEGKQPEYHVEGEGPDHARTFTATVSVDGEVRGRGEGRSKKEAQQAAAREAMRA